MKNRSEKQQDLDKLKTELAKVSTVILSTFQGITVEDDTKLRRAVQAAGGKYKVVKDVPAFQFKSGVVEGRVISIAEIQQLANLPSKDELISKIMFLLNAPAQRIAMALNALPRNLAVTVSEAIKANKFGSGGASAESSAAPAPETAQ